MKRWIHAAEDIAYYSDADIDAILIHAEEGRTPEYNFTKDFDDVKDFKRELSRQDNSQLRHRTLDRYKKIINGRVQSSALGDILLIIGKDPSVSSRDLEVILKDEYACYKLGRVLAKDPRANEHILDLLISGGEGFYVAQSPKLTHRLADRIIDESEYPKTIFRLLEAHPELIESILDRLEDLAPLDKVEYADTVIKFSKMFPEYAREFKSLLSDPKSSDKYTREFFEEIHDIPGRFKTVNKEFEYLYNKFDGDVKGVLSYIDSSYGNGKVLRPLDWGSGAVEAFVHWIDMYHPEAYNS